MSATTTAYGEEEQRDIRSLQYVSSAPCAQQSPVRTNPTITLATAI
ncbi:uncharacterized protein ARMOST_01765 [Armillaria ostoyae]|uniref:Uncharacterized protein n=1 Tax=Armillaria ostoyae TaxID=47428 RepID=A0A284QPV4_ARMOS|nr:uncharacterized protein ARMOST_01765 [Armillaria ostoyae]